MKKASDAVCITIQQIGERQKQKDSKSDNLAQKLGITNHLLPAVALPEDAEKSHTAGRKSRNDVFRQDRF